MSLEARKAKSDYNDRHEQRRLRTSNKLCLNCRFTAKNLMYTCSRCGKSECIVSVGYKARFPRATASKAVWKKFIKKFMKYHCIIKYRSG